MAKILIVDDEPELVQVLSDILARDHHLIEVAEDGIEALSFMRGSNYELVILDVMLPGVDGLEVCQTYRSTGGEAAILMLTARSSVDDRALGLDLGADDYLAKPFHNKELLSRVRALLRRNITGRVDQVITMGNLTLNLRTSVVQRNGQEIHLSRKESDLLFFLARRKGVFFSAEQLAQRIWHSNSPPLPDTVRSHIKNLRHKLDLSGEPSTITHVRGYGYAVESEAVCQRQLNHERNVQ
jgi:DNA-binding response OmpR family regulator